MILEGDNLSFTYLGERRPSFEEVSFQAITGQTYKLSGSNGSGKTTLLKILAGAWPLILKGISSGTLRLDGASTAFSSLGKMSSFVPTPEHAAFLGDSAIDEASITATNVDRDRLLQFSKLLPSREVLNRPLWSLSDGELQRVLLFISLSTGRPLQLWDEPTLHLDSRSLELLSAIVRSGELSDTITIFTSSHSSDKHIAIQNAEDISALQPIQSPATKRSHTSAMRNNCILALSFKSIKYASSNLFLANAISININRSSVTCIQGPNGSGKSTLARILAGYQSRSLRINSYRRNVLKGARIVFLDSEPIRQISESSVLSEMELIAGTKIIPDKHINDMRLGWLHDVLDNDPRSCSFGQQKMILALSMFIAKPDVIIADEMFSGIDKAHLQVLLDYVREYVKNGGALVFTEQQGQSLKVNANHVIALSNSDIEESTLSVGHHDTYFFGRIIDSRITALLSPAFLLASSLLLIIVPLKLNMLENAVLLAGLLVLYSSVRSRLYWTPSLLAMLSLPVVVIAISFLDTSSSLSIDDRLLLGIKAANWVFLPIIALKMLKQSSLLDISNQYVQRNIAGVVAVITLAAGMHRRAIRVTNGLLLKTSGRYFVRKGRINGLFSLIPVWMSAVIDLAAEHRVALYGRLETLSPRIAVRYCVPLVVQYLILVVMALIVIYKMIILSS